MPVKKGSIFTKGLRLKASMDTTGTVSTEVSPRGGVKLPGSEEEYTYDDYSKLKAVTNDTKNKLRKTPTEIEEARRYSEPQLRI